MPWLNWAPIGLLLAGIGVGAWWVPGTSAAVIVLAVAGVLAMPHGALDVAVGPVVLRSSFLPLYLASGGATLLCWLLAPTWSFAGFVIVAWWHFGRGDAAHVPGDRRGAQLHGVASGGAVLGGSLTIHRDLAAPIVERVAGESAMSTLAPLGAVMLATATVAGAFAIRRHATAGSARFAVELVSLGVLTLVAHPVVAFAVYFVGVHALRHLLELRARHVAVRSWLLVAAASMAPVIAAAVTVAVATPSSVTLARVAMIGLAVLTTPHVVVTEAMRRFDRHSPSPRGASSIETDRAELRVGSALTGDDKLRAWRRTHPTTVFPTSRTT
ncbi:MAG: Brp/Blh family beta-carotene 15,15'-dioxygenase [Actinomycetota bacterium]